MSPKEKTPDRNQFFRGFSFCLADDLGYGDLGCYRSTKVKTPSLHRLAREGRAFKVSRMRKQRRQGETVNNEFTEQEREDMV